MWAEKLRIRKNNVIADLYPLTKLWIAILYSFCVIILGTMKVDGYPVYLMAAFVFVPVLALLSGVFNKFLKVFKGIFTFCLFILVVQALVIKSEEIVFGFKLFRNFSINVYKAGLQKGLDLSFNIMNIASILAWFFQTTENKELAYALEKKGMPPKASYVFLSTLQMIKVLQRNSRTIMNAQQARGVETEGNLFVRVRAFLPSMIPLIMGSIANTEERVLTLESKGFSVKCKKTHIFDVVPSGNERTAMIIAVAITILVVVWRVLMWVL